MTAESGPSEATRYTAKGNLVAVVSNGTAVLGLGNIGAAGRQAGDGRQGRSVQALRRYRRLRYRAGHRGPRRDHPHLPDPGADLRRHQPGRHQGAGVLRDRGRAAEHHEDSGLPRRSARHRHHLRRRPAERPGNRRQEHRPSVKVVFNGAGASAISCAAHYVQPGRAPRKHRDVRHQGRDLRRPHRGHERLQGALRRRNRGPHPGRCAGGRRRVLRPFERRLRDRRNGEDHGAQSRSSSPWPIPIPRSPTTWPWPRARTPSWPPDAPIFPTR